MVGVLVLIAEVVVVLVVVLFAILPRPAGRARNATVNGAGFGAYAVKNVSDNAELLALEGQATAGAVRRQ